MRFIGYVVAVTTSIACLMFFGASVYSALATQNGMFLSGCLFVAGAVVSAVGLLTAHEFVIADCRWR